MKTEWTIEEMGHDAEWRVREYTTEKVRELCDEHPAPYWDDWDYAHFYAIRDVVLARIAATEEALGPERVKEIYIRCGSSLSSLPPVPE